jgi:acyl carrier protein
VATAERIRRLVIDDLGYRGSPSDLKDDFPLIDNRVIDSLEMLKLISLIEEEFEVEVDDEELVPENFGTIGAIARFVEQKRGPGTT